MSDVIATGAAPNDNSPEATPAVRVVGLSKEFRVRARRGSGGQHVVAAVRDVSFTVPSGTCLGIAGESGSGKSTVARMLVGLEVATTGEIWVGGERLPEPPSAADRRAHARRVQMVFQDTYSSLDPRQTVSQAIDEVQHVHFDRTPSERRKRTIELLDAVRVGDRYVDALPRALSGGQRQRVAIARSLAAQPSVLVLDEAVSALDVSTQAQILNLLSDLRSEFGLTYIFISHDLAVIRQVSDDVLVLYRGDLMEQAPAEELFGMPEHPYTGLLLDSIPRQGMELENRPDRGSLDEAGCLFSSRCSRAFDRCTEHPPIFDLTYGRRSRCWLVDPSAAHTSSPPVSLTTQQGGTDDQHRTAQ